MTKAKDIDPRALYSGKDIERMFNLSENQVKYYTLIGRLPPKREVGPTAKLYVGHELKEYVQALEKKKEPINLRLKNVSA